MNAVYVRCTTLPFKRVLYCTLSIMYLKYRALPEFNRVCIKASRDRAYQQHMDALRRMRPVVDTRKPVTPQTVGRNYKRYEIEQQRNVTIERDNRRLLGKINDVQRDEHYPRAIPQRPFTLMGQTQKDEMTRVTRENRKILNAVQDRRPGLNRNDWLMHRLDHEYQITKMSQFRKTVPMGEIVRQERARTARGSLDGGSQSRPYEPEVEPAEEPPAMEKPAAQEAAPAKGSGSGAAPKDKASTSSSGSGKEPEGAKSPTADP